MQPCFLASTMLSSHADESMKLSKVKCPVAILGHFSRRRAPCLGYSSQPIEHTETCYIEQKNRVQGTLIISRGPSSRRSDSRQLPTRLPTFCFGSRVMIGFTYRREVLEAIKQLTLGVNIVYHARPFHMFAFHCMLGWRWC